MSTKAEQYISQMEESNLLMEKEMTFVEYSESLIQFQNMVTQMVMGEDYEEGMRIDEAIFRLESKARAKGVSSDHQFRKGIAALRTVAKEVAICISGKKAENLVARTLEFVERPNTTMYRNLYISNGIEETELDNVLLTDSGIVILEVKNTKDDVTVTEEGRLVHSGDECYDKQPLCEKMQKKRKLLKERLESVMVEKNLDIPIRVESFIVFSTPKGMRINVEDRYRKEKWCYRSGLKNKIEYYIGLASYNKEQLAELDVILGDIETQIKRFALTVNFDEVRADIARALAMFEEDPIVNETPVVKKKVVKRAEKKQAGNIIDIVNAYAKREAAKRTAISAVMVGAMTGLACVGASVMIGRR